MAKKKKCPACPAGEKWAVPYADFLSLLLALFIALWAISETNPIQAELLKTEFIKVFDYTLTAPVPTNEADIDENDLETSSTAAQSGAASAAELNDATQEGGILEQVEMGTSLRLPTSLMFESGKAEITNSDAFLYLNRISAIIKKMPEYVKIDVRGYTDNTPPPATSRFRDNYELSAARSLAVMKAMIKNGIPADRISFSGYGEQHPQEPNDSLINKSKNNRVEFFFFIDPKDVPQTQSILEQVIQENNLQE